MMKVLYVADNAHEIELTRRHLAQYAPHIELDAVHHTAEALERLPVDPTARGEQPKAYDLLMLDCRAPGLSAPELLKILRSERRLDLPVVLVTEQGSEEVAVQALRLGATGYLTKHANYLYELAAVLENAYHQAQLVREQTALRESEARYRGLYEGSTIGVYRTTPGGQIIMANPTLVAMLGYDSFDELASRDLQQGGYAPAYERAHFIESIEREGEIRGLESAWTRGDGSTVFVRESARAVRDAQGHTLYYDGVVEDITERKRTEAALQQSTALLDTAGRLARFGGWSVDLAADKVIWSDQVAVIHEAEPGFSPSLAEGINFYAPEWRERITEVFTACAEKGVSYDEEMEIITTRGHRVWVRTTGSAVRDQTGAIVRVEGAFQDITARKKAEIKLAEQLDELRRWYKATLGREARIMELKREINDLLAELGRPLRYPSAVGNGDKELNSADRPPADDAHIDRRQNEAESA